MSPPAVRRSTVTGNAADLQSRMDEYAAKVARRVAEEAAADPEGSKVNGEIKPGFIRACFDANELGDGLLFKAVNRGRLLFDKAMDSWLVWTSHHWAVDRMGAARAGVEKVVEKYGEELAAINKKIREAEADGAGEQLAFFRARAKGLRGRISQLRSRRRANNCLDFSHNCEDPMAIRGDEIDRKPLLLACANGVINLATGELEPGRQDQYLLKASPVEWQGIDAPCPLWEEKLLEIFSGDERLMSFPAKSPGLCPDRRSQGVHHRGADRHRPQRQVPDRGGAVRDHGTAWPAPCDRRCSWTRCG